MPLYLLGQDLTQNTITIDASTTIETPADMIRFRITLNTESDSAHTAFEKHRMLEKRLVQLIERYEVKDSDITYSLMGIRKQKDREDKITYITDQRVNLDLYDIDNYYDYQLTLLTSGFDQFRSKFTVKNESALIEKGYEKAIKNVNKPYLCKVKEW